MKSLALKSDGPELLWSAPCFPQFPFFFNERTESRICFFPFFSPEHEDMTIHFRALILQVLISTGAKCKALLLGVRYPFLSLLLWSCPQAHLHPLVHNYIDLIPPLMKQQALTHFYVLLSSSEGSFL